MNQEQSPMRLYLAGPVNSTCWSTATARNKRLAAIAESLGWEVLDPLAFDGNEKLHGHVGDLDAKAEAMGVATPAQIVEGCLGLLSLAEALLVDLRGMEPGTMLWGTPCEVFAAWDAGKPVCILLDPGAKTSAWMKHMAQLVFSFDYPGFKREPDAVVTALGWLASKVEAERAETQAAHENLVEALSRSGLMFDGEAIVEIDAMRGGAGDDTDPTNLPTQAA